MEMIFIGGVHAVGKGTLCHRLHEELGIISYSSSKLIESARNLTFSADKKTKVNIDNQSALITAVQQKKAEHESFILDGHFCLKGSEGIEAIPDSVFLDMAPAAIIVLMANPEVIQQRRIERDCIVEDLEEITSFQNLELQAAKNIATKLRIPFLQADTIVDYDYIKKFICNIIPPSLS